MNLFSFGYFWWWMMQNYFISTDGRYIIISYEYLGWSCLLSRLLLVFTVCESNCCVFAQFCLGLIGEDSEDPLQVKVKMDLVKEWRNLLACISGSHPSFINDSVWPKVALSFLESLSQYNIQTDTVEVRYIVEAYLLLMKNLKKWVIF